MDREHAKYGLKLSIFALLLWRAAPQHSQLCLPPIAPQNSNCAFLNMLSSELKPWTVFATLLSTCTLALAAQQVNWGAFLLRHVTNACYVAPCGVPEWARVAGSYRRQLLPLTRPTLRSLPPPPWLLCSRSWLEAALAAAGR